MKNRGALEFSQKHHKLFIVTHIAFFVAIILEMQVPGHMATNINPFFMTLFLATQVLRIWCITSLGMYWNTKIIILPEDRKSTRLNSSHVSISYAVFCLKK